MLDFSTVIAESGTFGEIGQEFLVSNEVSTPHECYTELRFRIDPQHDGTLYLRVLWRYLDELDNPSSKLRWELIPAGEVSFGHAGIAFANVASAIARAEDAAYALSCGAHVRDIDSAARLARWILAASL